MLVADLPYSLEVAGRGREASTTVLHGFQEHRGDRLRTFELDHLLDAVRGPQAERLEVFAVLGRTVEIRVGHAESAGHEGFEHLFHRRNPGDREGTLRRAVVGDGPGDDLVLGGAPLQLPVVLGQFESGLDRFTATGREEYAVEVSRCVVGEPVGQFDGRRMCVRPQGEEREFLGLLGRDLG